MPASRAARRMDSVLAAFQLAVVTTWLRPRTTPRLPVISESPAEHAVSRRIPQSASFCRIARRIPPSARPRHPKDASTHHEIDIDNRQARDWYVAILIDISEVQDNGGKLHVRDHTLVHSSPPQDAPTDVAHRHLRRRQHSSRGGSSQHVAAGGIETAEGSGGHARRDAV